MQGKALGAQQQEVAGTMTAADKACKLWLTKLTGMEQLLYSAQSAQFLDIRKREAEAFKVGIDPKACDRIAVKIPCYGVTL